MALSQTFCPFELRLLALCWAALAWVAAPAIWTAVRDNREPTTSSGPSCRARTRHSALNSKRYGGLTRSCFGDAVPSDDAGNLPGMRTETVDNDQGAPVAGRWLDATVPVGLTVASYVLVRDGRPHQGLWYDWAPVGVALGAVHGDVGDILLTGGAHPGFTLLLWLQHHIVGGDVERLALLAFLLGVAGPAIVYAALRSLGYERSSSLLASGALVVATVHVTYSGRVKTYAIETAFAMVLAAILPRLAARRWTWVDAAAWVGAALVLGSLSGYLLVASAVAVGILVLHPAGDRAQRLAAMAVQGAAQVPPCCWPAATSTSRRSRNTWRRLTTGTWGSSPTNPVTMASNLLRHLSRVVDVHPGGPDAWLGVVGVAIVTGLVVGALGRLDRPRALASRYVPGAPVVRRRRRRFRQVPLRSPTTTSRPYSALPGPVIPCGSSQPPRSAAATCSTSSSAGSHTTAPGLRSTPPSSPPPPGW